MPADGPQFLSPEGRIAVSGSFAAARRDCRSGTSQSRTILLAR